ncbi:DctP family TRAP transporter solute-binding subunit [Microbacterium sp. BR1]|uniref:DctP family TRAP transporter solute-binding subunit n=1 Tax=Microbacterium sp. BR1 TaxID=1070896 RepID=UPI001E59D9CF|nr:DctP family TRAP transporter solute-binding subunit [Microbacterium sp. BR1]
MKLHRAMISVAVVGIATTVLAGCGGASSPAATDGAEGGSALPATTIRLAVGDPAASSVGQAAEHFAEAADELSDGAIQVEVFTDGTLFNGDQNAAVNLLGNGTLDATIISTSVYASFAPGMNAISLPFLFGDMDEFSDYLAGEPGQELLTSLEDQGIAGLAMLTRTPRVTTNSKAPVEEPEDFEGMRIRVPQNELWVKFFGELGANPTPMDFKEVYTALQLGTIDGQENPIEVPVSNKFFEVQDYLSLTNHISDGYVLGFNKDKFDGYAPEVQDVLREAAADTADWKREADDAEVEEILADLEAQGVQINELTDEARGRFAEIALELYPSFEPLVGEEFMSRTLEYLGR